MKEIYNCSLNKNFNLIYCNDITNIKKLISNKNPETIIFDLDNLSNNKIKSFKYVRSLTNKPIIVISSNNNTDDIVLFFSLEADDEDIAFLIALVIAIDNIIDKITKS